MHASLIAFATVLRRRRNAADRGRSVVLVNTMMRSSFDDVVFSPDIRRERVASFSASSLEKPNARRARVRGPTHAQNARTSIRRMRRARVIPMR